MEAEREIKQLQDNFEQNFSRANVRLFDSICQEVFAQKGISGEDQQVQAFTLFLEQKEIKLDTVDLFAGQIQHYLMRHSQPLPADGDPWSFDPAVIKTGAVNPPENARATVDMCRTCNFTPAEQETLSFLEPGVAAGYFTHYPIGHAITGFPFVIQKGWERIKELLRERMDQNQDNAKKMATGKVMLKTIEACQQYFRRYAVRAKQLEKSAETPEVRCRMKRISEGVEHLITEPARNFYEALQFVILLQELILTQVKGSMSLGRADQFLYPYWAADVKQGVESAENSQLLIEAWMLKLAGCIHGFQNVTLGGCGEDGNYAGNEISLMILRGARHLGYDQPLISFRLSEQVPQEHWEEIFKTLEKGGGFPALFWDETIIQSRLRLGVPLADARDYGIVGCVEPSISGKEFANTEAMRINWCKTLELMLNSGICPITGKQLFLREKKSLDEIENFPEFLEWYRSELFFVIEKAAEICNLSDRHFYKRYPSTLLSITLEGGIERLEDCAGRGCTYCNSTINHTGIANAVDSLMAIKRMVFEEKKVTLTEYRDILRHNYQGAEELQGLIGDKVPKFGNDVEEADALAALLVNETAQKTQSIKNERGGTFLAGYYSVYHHAAMGLLTGALPDGRLKGAALSNGLSPSQGADKNGPTAVVCSMAGFDQTQFANGMVLDLKFNPSFFRREERRKFLQQFILVYFKQGGMELQLNVVDRQTLLAAKEHPENYRNLIVRVSGFSAYFVNLFEELQDEIIRRTEYSG